MSRRHLALVCVVVLAFGIAGCKKKQAPIANRLGPVAQQAAKPPPPTHPIPNVRMTALTNEKGAYVASARQQLDDMQARMTPLQVAAAKTTGATRVSYGKLIADVAQKRAAFQADLAAIPNASQDAWPALRVKADHDLMALRGAVAAATSRIPTAPRSAAVPVKLTQ